MSPRILSFLRFCYAAPCLGLFCCNSFVDVTRPDKKSIAAKSPEHPSIVPSSLNLTADRELFSITIDTTSALTTPASGPLAVTNNIFAVAAAPGLAGPGANTNVPQAPAGPSAVVNGIVSASSPSDVRAGHASFNASISTAGTFSGSLDSSYQACEFLAPYSSIACALGLNTIASSLLTNGNLSAKLFVKDKPSITVTSNVLATKNYMFKVLTNFTTSEGIKSLTPFNSWAYFLGKGTAGFYKVFRTNGSTVEQITDTYPGADDRTLGYFAEYNGYLYFGSSFSATDTNKLMRTNGSTLERLSNTNVGASDGYAFSQDSVHAQVCNDTLFLFGTNAGGFNRYHSFNGSTLRILTNFGTASSDTINTISMSNICINNRLYIPILASDAPTYNRFYSSNGSDLQQISNTSGGANDRVHTVYSKIGSKVVFGASTDGTNNGVKLHITDGTTVNAETNTCAGCNNVGLVYGPYSLNGANMLLVGLNQTAAIAKLYTHDGTTLKQITDTCSGCTDAGAAFDVPAAQPQNVVYFKANVSIGAAKLFKFDGTTVTQISDLKSGGSDNPTLVGFMNNYLFVTLFNSSGFTKLYSYDGSTLRQISDLNPGSSDTIYRFNASLNSQLNPNVSTVFDGRFYFMALDSANQNHLYSSNGTDLMQMTNFNTGNGGEFIINGACGGINPTMLVMGAKAYMNGVRTDSTACNDHLGVLIKP